VTNDNNRDLRPIAFSLWNKSLRARTAKKRFKTVNIRLQIDNIAMTFGDFVMTFCDKVRRTPRRL